MQNKANFMRFSGQKRPLGKKQSQNKPNQTQSCHGAALAKTDFWLYLSQGFSVSSVFSVA